MNLHSICSPKARLISQVQVERALITQKTYSCIEFDLGVLLVCCPDRLRKAVTGRSYSSLLCGIPAAIRCARAHHRWEGSNGVIADGVSVHLVFADYLNWSFIYID